MKDRDLRTILFFAFRYALGRHSTAPTTVCNQIKENIELFNVYDLDMIEEEIREELNSGNYSDASHSVDAETWEELLDYIEEYNVKTK